MRLLRSAPQTHTYSIIRIWMACAGYGAGDRGGSAARRVRRLGTGDGVDGAAAVLGATHQCGVGCACSLSFEHDTRNYFLQP